jgi:hypothetical protein
MRIVDPEDTSPSGLVQRQRVTDPVRPTFVGRDARAARDDELHGRRASRRGGLGQADFIAGAAVKATYTDFRVFRIDQMPALDTIILDSGAAPGGYGEHPVPLVAPGIANAIFAATGKRLRRLPLTPTALQRP